MSDARKNHLLAVDHGWIDLTIKGVPNPEKSGAQECAVALSANGEIILREGANFVEAIAKANPVGYRFPAAAGQSDLELSYSGCSKEAFIVKQTVSISKDHLVNLVFDGNKLNLESTVEYNPASLDLIRTQLETLRNASAHTEHQLSNTNLYVLLCLALNLVVGLFLILRRRRV